MKSRQVKHDRGNRQEGGKGRQRERERERERERAKERFRERGRATQWREKTVWVDFDHWSKSTTPENFLRVSINQLEQWKDNCQSRFGGGAQHSSSNLAQQHWLE
jgi:hypothetical protein